jgi:hypothetical protein
MAEAADHSPLSTDEQFFLEALLKLTGREERLSRSPVLTRDQAAAFQALLPGIKLAGSKGLGARTKCDLFNRLVLSLGIKPISQGTFDTVLSTIDLQSENSVRERVEMFRILCMLEFGSFRYGYKVLRAGTGRRGESIQDLWDRHFPSVTEIERRVKEYKEKPGPLGLTAIPAAQLSALGYLSSEATVRINEVRSQLKHLLEEAIQAGVKSVTELSKIAQQRGLGDLANSVAAAGIPDGDQLLYHRLAAPGSDFRQLMERARSGCEAMDENVIKQARDFGTQNTLTYLAMHDVDVYVATSMRSPIHFANNSSFVQRLFGSGELQSWNLRYFDPTQSYVPDRILKGLTECLMIKRALVTVYNAQDSDTFGKDAEAAVALAQGKPVVVYVTRLFSHIERLTALYELVDSAIRAKKPAFLSELRSKGFITNPEMIAMEAPERSTMDVVEFALDKTVRSTLAGGTRAEIEAELVQNGYEPPKGQTADQVISFAAGNVVKLERRALTFREIHPLALQASPVDGVARGVIVTRSVERTAEILRGLLVGGLTYKIVDRDQCWDLVEWSTRSPVRVVAKDPVLTTAFWNEWSSAD